MQSNHSPEDNIHGRCVFQIVSDTEVLHDFDRHFPSFPFCISHYRLSENPVFIVLFCVTVQLQFIVCLCFFLHLFMAMLHLIIMVL